MSRIVEDKKEAVMQEAADLIHEFADKLNNKLKEYVELSNSKIVGPTIVESKMEDQ